jgi:hypothetical protein
VSWSGMALTKRKSFPVLAEPESVDAGRQGLSGSYFSDWPRVSGMRMKVINVITAPAST